jgi:hypothetical protein
MFNDTDNLAPKWLLWKDTPLIRKAMHCCKAILTPRKGQMGLGQCIWWTVLTFLRLPGLQRRPVLWQVKYQRTIT